jgi:hypothetical protein
VILFLCILIAVVAPPFPGGFTPKITTQTNSTPSVKSAASIPKGATFAWNPSPSTVGYDLTATFSDGTIYHTWVTTQTNITVQPPAGFILTYRVTAWNYRSGGTNGIKHYGLTSVAVTNSLPLATNTLSIIGVSNQWRLMTLASTNVELYSSTNLTTWEPLLGISAGEQIYLTGTMTGNEWFSLRH